MTDKNKKQDRFILEKIAHRVMTENELLPVFSPKALSQLDSIVEPASLEVKLVRDLRNILWSSIDNDDSLDLDQLTAAQAISNSETKIFVAVSDVDALVKKYSALDEHAIHNTLSVYTTAKTFPMLPEKLSTNLTSLNYDTERLAIVIEMVVGNDGRLRSSDIYRAAVTNKAKLCYNSVAAWLDEKEPMPKEIARVAGLEENLRLQDSIAQNLRKFRHENGALNLETIEGRPVFDGLELKDFIAEDTNRATQIIEDFMIAANGCIARFLSAKKFPSLRRIVRTPKNWDRIVSLAAERKFKLPAKPDSKALESFLIAEKAADPLRFPDLSLSIIKLLGPGEYVVEMPGEVSIGHFGLAVRDYAHSTAPNRRYPDLVTQRLVKAAIYGEMIPYEKTELEQIAKHCTEQEDTAKKVERHVAKSGAALLLKSRIGEKFDAIVTGESAKGLWVRVLQPPVEGMLSSGFGNLNVGNRVRVQLVATDIELGFIDFKCIALLP